MKTCKASVLAILFLVAHAPLARAQGTYTNIDVPGASYTYVEGINNSGEWVGEFGDATGGHGFIFSAGSYILVDYPGSTSTGLVGINDKGQVVGGAVVPPSSVTFVYDRATATFTQVKYHGEPAYASAINNRGTVVGYLPDGTGFEKSASGREKAVTIQDATAVSPSGISDSGVVMGTYNARGGDLRSFQWKTGRSRQFKIPGLMGGGFVYGINPSGTAVVGAVRAGAPTDAFLYQGGTPQILTYPGAYATYASEVNDFGTVIGIYYDYDDHLHGFMWTATTTQALQHRPATTMAP